MKILIMGFSKIKYMPYLNFYLDQIDRNRNEVHLAYWNRDLVEEDISHLAGITVHEFLMYQEDQVSPLSKVRSFLCYRKFVLRILREAFDMVIALHTFPGVLLSDKLLGKYHGRFIFDYRDKTYENLEPFKGLIHRLVRASLSTFVSSDAFRSLLPETEQHKINTSHNILRQDIQSRDNTPIVRQPSERIRISFWGILRNEELNREIIRKVAEDERFELHYYGREQSVSRNLKDYVQSIGTDRIYFHGAYIPSDRYAFAGDADMIHNLYADGNMMLAMANKFYDGLIFKLPQLCMRGSYMGKCAEKAGVGLVCDPYDEDFLERIYKYYRELNIEDFEKQCDITLQSILKQYEEGCSIIREATNSNL